jgi:acetyl-CoA carboxylase carboxyltransferase component
LPAEPRDPAALRDLIPANRKRVYDIRAVVDALCDETLELRRGFAPGMVTALARHQGQPFGVIANDPTHLGGAIDADGADKATRFMQLCDGFGLPLLFLCDTPGFMVGPEAERTATVRHFSRMFVTGANLEVPTGTIILRKGYGLGAQAMAAGSFKAPLFTVGWPTSEFGAMGLEGAVKLGMRRELEAIEDPEERTRVFDASVAAAYERGRGISMAAYFEIDDVIDPADSPRWIDSLFAPPAPAWWERPGKRRPNIDAW